MDNLMLQQQQQTQELSVENEDLKVLVITFNVSANYYSKRNSELSILVRVSNRNHPHKLINAIIVQLKSKQDSDEEKIYGVFIGLTSKKQCYKYNAIKRHGAFFPGIAAHFECHFYRDL